MLKSSDVMWASWFLTFSVHQLSKYLRNALLLYRNLSQEYTILIILRQCRKIVIILIKFLWALKLSTVMECFPLTNREVTAPEMILLSTWKVILYLHRLEMVFQRLDGILLWLRNCFSVRRYTAQRIFRKPIIYFNSFVIDNLLVFLQTTCFWLNIVLFL